MSGKSEPHVLWLKVDLDTWLLLCIDLVTGSPTGLPVKVGGSAATLAAPPFASRRFLADILQASNAGDVGSARQSVALGPGAVVMAKLAQKERCVRMRNFI